MRAIVLFIFFMVLLSSCATQRQQYAMMVPTNDPIYSEYYAKIQKVGGAIIPFVDSVNSSKYRSAIVIGPDPGASMDDNHMSVFTTALFSIVDDEEFACVMAHEIAHSVLNHSRNKKVVWGAVTAGSMALGVLIPGASAVNYIANPIISSGYSRSAEIEADMAAAKWVKKYMGIEKEACIRLETKLADYAKEHHAGNGGGWLSSHPYSEERINAIKGIKD
jgi:Zn-dependent protease with chaperone function